MMEDKMIEVLTQLQDAIATAAPAVWGAAIQSVLVDGIIWLTVAAMIPFILYACYYTFTHKKEWDLSNNADEGVTSFAMIIGTVSVVAFFPALISGLKLTLSPEWYAIERIKDLL